MQTKNTRIPEWIFSLFSAKAKKDKISFIDKLDEVVEALSLLNLSEIRLENWLLDLYKNDEKKRPRFLYESLQAMFNYWDQLEDDFNFPDFFQFVDRWSIATYYISSYLYTNKLSKEQWNDKELSARAESHIALVYLLGEEDFEKFVKAMEYVKADPFANSNASKKSKAIFLHEIFNNCTMKDLLLSPVVTKRESALYSLIQDISANKKLNLKTSTSRKFPILVDSKGLINKIAYLVYLCHKDSRMKTLPSFFDEKFLRDIVKIYHNLLLHDVNSLFHSNSLASIFKIAIATQGINETKQDISYLKGNLRDGHKHETLQNALEANLEEIENEEFLSNVNPEVLARTPMHLINEILDTQMKFTRRPELFELFAKNIYNIVIPIYKYLIQRDGSILESSNYYNESLSLYSSEQNVQLEARVNDEEHGSSYSCIILYLNDGQESQSKHGMTITLQISHESLEKLNYILHSNQTFSSVRLDKELYVRKILMDDSKEFVELSYRGTSTYFLHNQVLVDFKEVLKKYVESEEFKKLNQIYIIKHGIY